MLQSLYPSVIGVILTDVVWYKEYKSVLLRDEPTSGQAIFSSEREQVDAAMRETLGIRTGKSWWKFPISVSVSSGSAGFVVGNFHFSQQKVKQLATVNL